MTAGSRWVRRAGRATVATVRVAAAGASERAVRRTRVDPDWRRVDEHGRAAKLAPHQTIDVRKPVGRWRGIDPRRPRPVTGVVVKLAALGLWAGAVGGAWWLGARKRRGPLASVAELDQLGQTLGDAIAAMTAEPSDDAESAHDPGVR